MRILVLALALLPATAFAADKDPVRVPVPGRIGTECRNAENQWAKAAPRPVRPGTLGQEPVADQYLTVLRLQDGCDRPVKVRGAIGEDVRHYRQGF